MLPNVFGAEKRLDEIGDGLLDRVRARAQRFNDWVKFERLSFSERYAIGRLDICFLFEVGTHAQSVKGPVISIGPLKQGDLFCLRISKTDKVIGLQNGSAGCSGEPLIQHLFWKIYDLAGENEKAVFVAGIEAVKSAQNFIPAGYGWSARINSTTYVPAKFTWVLLILLSRLSGFLTKGNMSSKGLGALSCAIP
jgi:hypothetical protein